MRYAWCWNSARPPLPCCTRRLRIGYGRAAHLIDMMERDGLSAPLTVRSRRESSSHLDLWGWQIQFEPALR